MKHSGSLVILRELNQRLWRQSQSLGWFGHGIDPSRDDCTVAGSAVDLLEIKSLCEDGVDQEFNPSLVLKSEGFSTVVDFWSK